MHAIKNKVHLWGYLVNDPDLRLLENGVKKVLLTLATNELATNYLGEDLSETQWHQLVGWEDVAEQAMLHLKRGTEVAVNGKLQSRNFTDNFGLRRFVTEVVIKDIKIIVANKVIKFSDKRKLV